MIYKGLSMNDEFLSWCRELLSPLGTVRSCRMFGGHGLYVDEVFLALIAGGRLYLKADDESRPRFEAAGSRPFEYRRAGGQDTATSYFAAPEEAMDSPAQMQDWARLAMASALRARTSKGPAKARARSAAPRPAQPKKARPG